MPYSGPGAVTTSRTKSEVHNRRHVAKQIAQLKRAAFVEEDVQMSVLKNTVGSRR